MLTIRAMLVDSPPAVSFQSTFAPPRGKDRHSTSERRGNDRMKTTIAALAALLLSAGGAAAACRTSDIAGTWLVTMTGDVTCTMETSTAGNISRGNCYVMPAFLPVGTLSGFFEAKNSCAVTGTIIQTVGRRRIEASFKGKLRGGKQVLAGIAKTPQTEAAIVAARQW